MRDKQCKNTPLWATRSQTLVHHAVLDTVTWGHTQHWFLHPNNLLSVLKSVKFPCGFWGWKNTQVELTIFFLHFLWGDLLIRLTSMAVLTSGVKIAWVQQRLCEHPTQAKSNNKKVCPLNADQNQGFRSSGSALYERWSVEWTRDLSAGCVRLTSTQRGFEL